MKLSVDIIIDYPQWRVHKEINKKYIKQVLKQVLMVAGVVAKSVDLAILLTDDGSIQDLNTTYLDKVKPTNILSFPLNDIVTYGTNVEVLYLGDLVFSYQTIKTESLEPPSFFDHFTHLLVHGVLHLLGYLHDSEDIAATMEALEIKILETLSIRNPYH